MSPWLPIGGLAAAITAYFVWNKKHALAQTYAPQASAPYTDWPPASLQHALSLLGYDVPQTGVYDAQTVSAVRLYQQRNGLIVDGIVGPQTSGKIHQDLSDIGLAGEL
jgi:peptidoglycan hydrolase-like protein with peptidoglycan-binding domain